MHTPTFKIHASEIGTDYWIYIETPEKTSSPEPWSAILFLDGDDQFKSAIKARQNLSNRMTSKPLLLVGVGYDASYTREGNKRARDYTQVSAHGEPDSGGADKFLRFLTQSLWPELVARYPINPIERGLAGYSLGALFVLYALFQPKPFFTHYLAGAPSIWWGDNAMFAQIADLHAREPAIAGKLFAGIGEKDSVSMRREFDRLEQQLGDLKLPKLEFTAQRFPKKNHFNAIDLAFETGLIKLYGGSLM